MSKTIRVKSPNGKFYNVSNGRIDLADDSAVSQKAKVNAEVSVLAGTLENSSATYLSLDAQQIEKSGATYLSMPEHGATYFSMPEHGATYFSFAQAA